MYMWKQHFENLLGKPLKVTNELIAKIIINPLDIELGQFTQEHDLVKKKKKKKKENCRAWWNTLRSREN